MDSFRNAQPKRRLASRSGLVSSRRGVFWRQGPKLTRGHYPERPQARSAGDSGAGPTRRGLRASQIPRKTLGAAARGDAGTEPGGGLRSGPWSRRDEGVSWIVTPKRRSCLGWTMNCAYTSGSTTSSRVSARRRIEVDPPWARRFAATAIGARHLIDRRHSIATERPGYRE